MVFASLAILDIFLMAAFAILMVVGATFDKRNAQTEPKWVFLILGAVVFGMMNWSSWKFFGESTSQVVLWDVVRTLTFWSSVGVYLSIGVAYSVLEFGLEIVRSARVYKEEWAAHLKSTITYTPRDEFGNRIPIDRTKSASLDNVQKIVIQIGTLYSKVKNGLWVSGDEGGIPHDEATTLAREQTQRFVQLALKDYSYSGSKIIGIRPNEDMIGVSPYVNVRELSDHVGAWTVLWPAYAASLILGDLFDEVFRGIGRAISGLSSFVVKHSFANVFKI